MKQKLIFLFYVILSQFPDLYPLKSYHQRVGLLRARLLGFLDGFHIGAGVFVYRGVTIARDSKLNVGDNVVIKECCKLGGRISIGPSVEINPWSIIDGSGGVVIGAETHIGRENNIFSHTHDIQSKKTKVLSAADVLMPVKIGANVMLFSRVGILGGVSIADGAVVGYGSLITKDLEADGIYAGVPARKIGRRN